MKRLLILPILALACTAQQRAETARAAEVFACEVAVLAPHVPEALDAVELARDVVKGQVNLAVALARLGVVKEQADEVIDAFNTCFTGQPPLQPLPEELQAPNETQTKLVAPPPAYGNKVL
jgi:hypothetical protein